MEIHHIERERKINCKYLSYQLKDGKFIKLPLVKITVVSPSDVKISTVALLDSGATVSFLPRTFAEDILSLPHVKDQVEVDGAGASFDCYISQAKLIVLKKGVKDFCEFRDITLHVPYPNVQDLPYAILGRDSVFRAFDITFRENSERFILKR